MFAKLTHIVVIMMMAFTIYSQQTFTASFVMRDVSGTFLKNSAVMKGTIAYDFTTGRAVKFTFPSRQYSELYEFNANRGATDAVDQYVHRAGSQCSGCETSTNQNEMMRLFKDSAYYTASGSSAVIGGATCQHFVRVASKTKMPVTDIWFGPGDSLCRFKMNNGRQFDISGVSNSVAAGSFTTPTGCKCGKMMDIVLVLDSSYSIDGTEWTQFMNFVKNFVKTFTPGPLQSGFGVVQFGYDTQIDLPLTTNAAQINLKLVDNTLKQFKVKSGTCLTCGMRDGIKLLQQYARPGATPVMVVATDGYHNRYLTAGCTGTGVQKAICDIQAWVKTAEAAIPGLQLFAIGVKGAGQDQLIATASGDATRVFKYDTFASFSTQFAAIAKRTCEAATDSSCGACCGFCACGTCLPPDTCDDANSCTREALSGQCCSAPAPFCFAPDKCTTSTCDPTTGACNPSIITCPKVTCKTVKCDPVSGCVYSDLCPPKDACTPRTCANDVCTDAPVQCPAGDRCTFFTCDKTNGQCVAASNSSKCIDADPCTDDTCNPKTGCINAKRCLDASDKCFTGFACNAADGACLKTPVNCDDNNKCTLDSCDSSTGCVNSRITCPPTGKDLCSLLDTTVGGGTGCDPTTGCVYKPKNCDDGKPFTFDICDPKTGICNNSDIPGYDKYCNQSTCHLPPASNLCFSYKCNSTLPMFNNCAILETKNCDDGDACTVNTCNNQTGCVTTATVCSAPPACMVSKCDKVKGCYNEAIQCDDKNPCTIDTCNPANNQCIYTLKCATSDDACSKKYCLAGECKVEDKCILSPDPCSRTTGKCNASGCETMPSCVDTDPCTIDTCTNGVCKFTQMMCDDGNACTRDYCSGGQCMSDPIVCDDNSNCTIDTCDPKTGCLNTPIDASVVCQDFDECTKDVCDPKMGCQNINISDSCNDNNNCTIDTCHRIRGCQYTPQTCPNSGCEIGFCEKGKCKLTQTNCLTSDTIVAAATVGSGVLAAIIIGIIVAISAAAAVAAQRLGLFDAGSALDNAGLSNPLYEQATKFGESKIYEGTTDTDKYVEMS